MPTPRLLFVQASLVASLLAFASVVRADENSHRQAAEELLDLVNPGDLFSETVASTAAQPLLENMKANGLPEEALDQTRAAFVAWAVEDLRYEDLKPRLLDLYVTAFTEAELREITAFYQTPVGKKTLEALPSLMASAMEAGQRYAKQKEAALMARLEPIFQQYRPAAHIEAAIRHNLRQLDAAAAQFQLEHGRQPTGLSDLVGSATHDLPVVQSVDGEDYDGLDFSVEAETWTVSTPRGVTVVFERGQ